MDSWAVDFGLLDAAGRLVGSPYHYRDPRNAAGVAEVHALVPPERLYDGRASSSSPSNTIYQLAAARRSGELAIADTMLLMPDLLGFWLTGERSAEATNASTTGLVDVRSGDWAGDLAELGLPASILPPIRRPGERLGRIRPGPCATGVTSVIGSPSWAPRHGVRGGGRAGRPRALRIHLVRTWALVGIELDAPVLRRTESVREFHECQACVDGRIRFLRNVTGLWLLRNRFEPGSAQVCLKTSMTSSSPPRRSAGGPIDPNDEAFLPPGDMPSRIADACRASGQPVPASRPALVRCVLDSLASAFAQTVHEAVGLSGRSVEARPPRRWRSRNRLLCQLTADACGLPVEPVRSRRRRSATSLSRPARTGAWRATSPRSGRWCGPPIRPAASTHASADRRPRRPRPHDRRVPSGLVDDADRTAARLAETGRFRRSGGGRSIRNAGCR